ncbi:MAG: thiamine biosynthesis protein ThiS [Verrucomicrobiales bacterium]|nr:thiamine biosynthesis protein ThiS [Verrucomicrobiales bacterium]
MGPMLEKMIAGGVDIVQLRAKGMAPDRVAELTRELHPISRAAGVPFILNDHPSLAGETGVEGAHVGVEDMSVAEARRLAGRACWIGKSSHSIAQALEGEEQGADYLGFGPLFPTPTKPDYIAIGLADIREVNERIAVPVFCIGGIKSENLPVVLAAGARRVVVVSGILVAADPAAYVRDCVAQLGGSPISG